MRLMLGLVALALAVGGALAWQAGDPTTGGILLRVGVVLAAMWIGWPALERIDRRTIWIVLPAAAVVVARPRSAIVVVPVLIWFLRSRRHGQDSEE